MPEKEGGILAVAREFEFLTQWHITRKCNLRCSHCYQDDGDGAEEMSLSEMADVVDEVTGTVRQWATEYDMPMRAAFSVTGGEPFLRDGIFTLIERMATSGSDVYVLTNGTLINIETVARLAELGVKGVQVSVEGPHETHDSIRGDGSYERALEGARLLAEAGLSVTLNSTLSAANSATFKEMFEIARGCGADKLGFARLVPTGRGAAMARSMLGPAQLRELYGSVFATECEGVTAVTGDPVATQMRAGEPEADMGGFPLGGCAAGVSGITLLEDGTMLPCRRLAVPLGNIRRDSLRQVWATSPVLQQLRDRQSYTGRCGSCPRWAGCRGCRAIAHASGGLTAEDPQCFLRDSA